jgi:hypothetical protein
MTDYEKIALSFSGKTRAIGYDPNGIPRVYVDDVDEAKDGTASIWAEIKAYTAHRPDTGPWDKWSVKLVLL